MLFDILVTVKKKNILVGMVILVIIISNFTNRKVCDCKFLLYFS